MKRTIRVIAIVGVLLLALAPMAGAGFWSDVKDSAKKSWKDITDVTGDKMRVVLRTK